MAPKNARRHKGVSPASKLHAAWTLRAGHSASTTVVDVEPVSTPIVPKTFVDFSVAIVIGFVADLGGCRACAQPAIGARGGPYASRILWTLERARNRKMLSPSTATAPSARNQKPLF